MKLTEDFYAYLWPGVSMAEMQQFGNNANTYIRAEALPNNKHVMIDPGMVANELRQDCLDRLISEMAKDDLAVEDIGLIINTHLHPDHYGASEAIKQLSGALISIGVGEEPFIKLMAEKKGNALSSMGIKLPALTPDLFLAEGELGFGNRLAAHILQTPGHSPGHIGIYWPDEKVFLSGDLIFKGSTGRVDLPGGSAEALKQSIEKIAQLDIEYLLTGHQYGSEGIIQGKEQVMRNFDVVRNEVFPYL